MPLSQIRPFFLAMALVLVISAPTAHAYLDAGSASMLFQAVLGALAAGLVFTKTYWARIKSVFGGEKPEPEEPKATE